MANRKIVKQACIVAGTLSFVFVTQLLTGCSSSTTTTLPDRTEVIVPSPKEPAPVPPPSSGREYVYRISNENCNCEEYRIADTKSGILYLFHATYKMQTGILTSIEVEISNNTPDTLTFDRGAIKVSSRNVKYQYNNKFLPLPWDPVLPGNTETRKLTGKEVTEQNDWHKVAGEQLTVTIKGLYLGSQELKSQAVTFVPENPNLGD
jgi:hypothetical protein